MLFGGVLSALLLAASPALATITAVLEEPAEGSASGIVQIRGHARAADDATVTVRLRVNGKTRTGDDGIIPCCSLRTDVTTDVPTGFSAQVNYGVFPAGALSIGVEITAPGCDPVVIDRSVQVVKLGGEEFATAVDLSGALIALDPDGNIVITGAQVNPEDNLTLSFQSGSQSWGVVDGDFDDSSHFFANLTLDQTIPGAIDAAGAWGEAFFILNGDSLDYIIKAANLSAAPIAAHIHLGTAGNAPADNVLFDFGAPDNAEDPFVYTGNTGPLDLTGLQSGGWYINVHTPDNAPGEIRGQVGAALQNVGCSDLRVFHPTEMPENPGTMAPTANQGCRLMNPLFCALSHQNPGGNPAFGDVNCEWFPSFDVCGACGPFTGCTNTCAPPS